MRSIRAVICAVQLSTERERQNRSKKSETDAGNNSGGVGPLVLLVLIVAVLIGLFIWSKGLFCIALVILLFIISAL